MINRVLPLCKPLLQQLSRNVARNTVSSRASHFASYRVAPPPASKATRIGAEVVCAGMWWWILWHLWHESDHITGEFPYPEASEWTNKELGIPS